MDVFGYDSADLMKEAKMFNRSKGEYPVFGGGIIHICKRIEVPKIIKGGIRKKQRKEVVVGYYYESDIKIGVTNSPIRRTGRGRILEWWEELAFEKKKAERKLKEQELLWRSLK